MTRSSHSSFETMTESSDGMDQKRSRKRFSKSVIMDTDRLMLLEGETPFNM